MPRGRRRAAGGQAALATVAVVLALTLPALAAAAQSWSITTSPTAVETGVLTDVDVTVTNTSGNNGGGQSIGCVRISIPATFSVASASIVSVTNGLSWSVTTSTSGATLVEATAAGDSERLRGDPDLDVLVLRIRVTGGTIGSYAWAADEFEKPDCSHDHVQPVALPMDVGTGTNDPPLAGDDNYAVLHDHALSVGAPGVLGDDTDPDLDALTAVLDGTTAHGSLTLSPDGSFDYTPDPGFVGSDSFSYHAEDGSASSASATVTIAVDDTAPVAVDDTYTVDRNGSISVGSGSGVLANDTDADPGETLAATELTGPSDGGLVLAADGSFSYTPDPGFSGTDTFTYRVSDGALTSTATVTIDVVNHGPNAVDDLYAGPPTLPLIVGAGAGVLANDDDPDGDPLTAALVSPTTSGAILLAADGGFTYTPAPGFSGTDQFTYEASDGLTVAVATVTIAISNGSPVAGDDVASAIHDRPLTVAAPGVLANDSDPNGDSLSATMLTGPISGTLILDPDGGYTYTPDPGFTGTDLFTYRAGDGAAMSGPATVTIDVTNALPVAVDDSYGGSKGRSLVVGAASGVLANDVDPDGDALAAVVASAPSDGSVVLAADGSFTYTPDPGFTGTDIFTYTASDGIGLDTAMVSITISNSTPVSSDDTFQVFRNRTLTIAASGVLADDTDADGDTLTAGLLVATSHGTLTLAPDGGFSYTPDAGYVGSDAFVYRATDGTDTSGPATVHIDVKDRKPVVTGEIATVATDSVVTRAAPGLLANDTDPDGDPLVALLGTDAAHGTATVHPDGSWSYSPDGGYSGDDSFTYVAFDGLLTSSPATVRLTVQAPAPSPTPQPTPTAIPVASAAEPTPLPSPTVTPTPSPTPTATASPTPTPTTAGLPPAAPPAGTTGEEAFSIPDTAGGLAGTDDMGLAAAALAGFGSILWAVPSLILSVPGLLLVVAILAQATGGLVWLPVVRRKVGAFGLRGPQAGATRS